jgi:hypothetical protein
MTFRVMCETHQGTVHIIRCGFLSEEEALDHPVTLSRWRRVWVEEEPQAPKRNETSPPLPWSIEWCGGFAYVVAADGTKIASLLGTQKRREFTAAILYSLLGETSAPGPLTPGPR